MLLSRIKLHLQEQNWVAILLDFLIVVVGIFIGMQVNDWNNYRQLNQDALTHLNNVVDEAQLNINSITTLNSHLTNHIDANIYVLERLQNCSIDENFQKEFETSLSNMSIDFLEQPKMTYLEQTLNTNYRRFYSDELNHFFDSLYTLLQRTNNTASYNHSTYWENHIYDKPELSLHLQDKSKIAFSTLKFIPSAEVKTLCDKAAFIKSYWKLTMLKEANQFIYEFQKKKFEELINKVSEFKKQNN